MDNSVDKRGLSLVVIAAFGRTEKAYWLKGKAGWEREEGYSVGRPVMTLHS